MRYVAIAITLFIVFCLILWGVAGFIALNWNLLLWNGIARFGLVLFWFVVCLPLSIMCTVGLIEMDKERAKAKKLRGH